MDGWANFFIAATGAAAALSGMLLVAMSINIGRIVSQPTLPARAANTLIVVSSALVISALTLMPFASTSILGVIVALVGGLILTSGMHTLRVIVSDRRAAIPRGRMILGMSGPIAVPLCYISGGFLLAYHNLAGTGLIATAVLVGFIVAVQNSWVLLVEILR